MALNIESIGSGRDLVVLHGWALHSGVFDHIAEALAAHFRVHFIDLPGHGHNAGQPMPDTLEMLARDVASQVPDNSLWLGWSLGGLVAMQAACRFPGKVARLACVASTPRFLAATDWPHAVQRSTLDKMAHDLERDFKATVNGFLSLQVLGDERAQSLLRELRGKLYAHGEPALQSLQHGLKILHDTDIRHEIVEVTRPMLAIYGQRDRLAPAAVGEWLSAASAEIENLEIRRAAHAPFLSHREEFLDAVLAFFQRQDNG